MACSGGPFGQVDSGRLGSAFARPVFSATWNCPSPPPGEVAETSGEGAPSRPHSIPGERRPRLLGDHPCSETTPAHDPHPQIVGERTCSCEKARNDSGAIPDGAGDWLARDGRRTRGGPRRGILRVADRQRLGGRQHGGAVRDPAKGQRRRRRRETRSGCAGGRTTSPRRSSFRRAARRTAKRIKYLGVSRARRRSSTSRDYVDQQHGRRRAADPGDRGTGSTCGGSRSPTARSAPAAITRTRCSAAKSASNNTFELLNIHHNFGPGLFIDTGNGGNLILNCDSHDNYDKNGSQGDGQNADGFGVHYQTSGPSTIIRGCRAWNDSDDGYDFISQEVPVTIEDSWAAERLRERRFGQPRRRQRQRVQGRQQPDPAFGTSCRTAWPGRTRRRASMPTTRRAATPGSTTRRT